jgi:hypothetical protein
MDKFLLICFRDDLAKKIADLALNNNLSFTGQVLLFLAGK